MLVARLIIFVDILIWMFPPFRQFQKRYFYYFLLLGISDPLFQIIYIFIKFDPFRLYEVFTPLMLLSVINFRLGKKDIFIAAFLLILNFIYTVFAPVSYLKVSLLVLHLIILSYFLVHATLELNHNKTINIFYFVLCLYQLSLAMKYLITITDLTTGVFYFLISTAFEILIAVFFIFFNEKNGPKLKIGLDI